MLDPVFLNDSRGRMHCTFLDPGSDFRSGDGILLLPPFAEEMNKSRRMMAQLGYSFAARGWVTGILDPFGTGESEGDFGDADWTIWREDVVAAAQALMQRATERIVVGGIRTGALLTLDVLDDLPCAPDRLLFWQPVTNGRQFLTRFLRLRLAASMIGGEFESTSDLRVRLNAGESLEIGGYELSPALADALEGLDASQLAPPAGTPVHWLEVSTAQPPKLSTAAERVIAGWRSSGCEVQEEAVSGHAFWATQEIVDVPELIERSVALLSEN